MSVEPPTHEEIQIDDEVEEIEEEEEDEEEVDEEEDVDEEEEEEEIEEVTHGRSTGRGLTLKTLVKEGILQPGEGLMTINYLGNKFKGDLLPDGRIRSQETNKIFGTPSAWAIYCKKIVNPDKKSGCGWASVRYRGKKLDSYKNNWFRQKQLEFEKEGEALDEEEMTDSDSDGPHEQEIVEFELIGNRHPNHDMNTMVELTSFQSLGRMQPFTVTMSSSAMAMIDIHAHLTTSEVVGYLAGQWDVTNHTDLIVSHALPVRCRLGDGEKGRVVEQALYAEMEKLNLSLVGWYHSHPFSPPLPSLRDIDSQLEYELKMKGSNDASYTPCIGIIVSPYVRGGGQGTTATGFWVMPPPEHKPQEYGRPMSIQFTIVQDAFIPKDALIHVRDTVKFFKDCPDSVVFSDVFQDRFTYWDKLKTAIRMCVPKDHYAPLMDYLAKLLELKNYVPEPTVVSGKSKSSTSGPKPQTSAELTPIESSSTTTVPSSVIKNRTSIDTGSGVVHIDENITAEVLKSSQTTVSVSPENLMSESVSILKSQTQVQSMEVSMPEAVRSPHLDTQQGHCEPKQLRAQQEEYQPPSYQQHSPPAYKPPQQEHLYEEQKQESEVQQEFLREQDYDKHQHKQTPQQYQQQLQYSQQIDDYQGDQKCEEELQKEYREPPPSYHQQHFTIPTGYIHEEPKTSRPLEDRVPGSDAQQVEEGTQGTSHYHEKLALDPWGGHRQSEPPHQSDSREVEVIQPMDLDTQS